MAVVVAIGITADGGRKVPAAAAIGVHLSDALAREPP